MRQQSQLSEKIQIRIPKDLLRTLDGIAKTRLISRSDVVREALLAYLQDGRKTGK